jgi:hypothetical protein
LITGVLICANVIARLIELDRFAPDRLWVTFPGPDTRVDVSIVGPRIPAMTLTTAEKLNVKSLHLNWCSVAWQ